MPHLSMKIQENALFFQKNIGKALLVLILVLPLHSQMRNKRTH